GKGAGAPGGRAADLTTGPNPRAKCVMGWAWPSSTTSKSAASRSRSGLPSLPVTTTSSSSSSVVTPSPGIGGAGFSWAGAGLGGAWTAAARSAVSTARAIEKRILPRGSVHPQGAHEPDVLAGRAHLDLVGAGLDRVAPLRGVVVREV